MANFHPHSPAKVHTHNNTRGPLLIISGPQDHTVPDVVTRSAYKLYKHSTAMTDLKQFDRGHSLTIDSGWREIAQAALDWLESHDLSGAIWWCGWWCGLGRVRRASTWTQPPSSRRPSS